MPVVAEEARRRAPRWLLLMAATTLVLLIVLPAGMLWVASSRPLVVRQGVHGIWLGPQRALEAQRVDVGRGWTRTIFPEAPNGAWPVGMETGAMPGGRTTVGAMPSTSLNYFQIGPVRYAVLVW